MSIKITVTVNGVKQPTKWNPVCCWCIICVMCFGLQAPMLAAIPELRRLYHPCKWKSHQELHPAGSAG